MYAIQYSAGVNGSNRHLKMGSARSGETTLPLLFNRAGLRSGREQRVCFDPQHPGNPHDRIEGRVRLSSLDVADEGATGPGAIGEILLGQSDRESQLTDVAAQSGPDTPLCFFKGLRPSHGSPANPSHPGTPGRRKTLHAQPATSRAHRLPRRFVAKDSSSPDGKRWQGLAIHSCVTGGRVLPASVGRFALHGQSCPVWHPEGRSGPWKLAFVSESLNHGAWEE